jgi:hypothetical protein
MHSAINGHWSQSMGMDFSGQHAMSAAISAAAISGIDPPMVTRAFAGPENGANTRPAITRIASSRPIWIDIFTPVFSHDPAAIGTSAGSLIRQNSCWMVKPLTNRPLRYLPDYVPLIRGASTHHGTLKGIGQDPYLRKVCHGTWPRRQGDKK